MFIYIYIYKICIYSGHPSENDEGKEIMDYALCEHGNKETKERF